MSEQNQPQEYTPQPEPDPEQPLNPPPSSPVTVGDVVEPTPPPDNDEEVLPPEEDVLAPKEEVPTDEPLASEPPSLEQRLQAVNSIEAQSDRIEHKLDLLLELGHWLQPAESLPQYAAGIRAAEPPTHLPLASAGPSQVLPEVAFYPEGTPPEEQLDQPQVGPQGGVPTTQYYPPPPVMPQTGAQA